MGFQDKDVSNRRLIDICIDMMSKKGNFKPAVDWLNIFSLYERRFLDATLICDIWDKIHYDDNERTLLVTMGDAHIVSLSSLLKIICKEEASIPADREGAIISPKNLNEFLNNHFEHAPSGESCVMM